MTNLSVLSSAPRPVKRALSGGVVAFNEEASVEQAIRSLLEQELVEGASWSDLWVVASGCTDATVSIVERIAASDARVHLVVEASRRGKAAAIGEVIARARGNLLVLLNADARAGSGAVAALLRAAEGLPAPFGVMARPIPPRGRHGFPAALELLWDLHHVLHLRLLESGTGTHLSDEMMLLSMAELPALPTDVVNDGSYLAGSIAKRGGALRYASSARVAVSVPGNLRDHVTQRRRILFGHHQTARRLGTSPTTFPKFARQAPSEALALLLATTLAHPRGLRSLALLATAELAALVLAVWDRVPPRRDHVRWQRVPESSHGPSTLAG